MGVSRVDLLVQGRNVGIYTWVLKTRLIEKNTHYFFKPNFWNRFATSRIWLEKNDGYFFSRLDGSLGAMCLESKRLFIHPCIATKKFLQGRHNLLNPQYSLGVAQMAFYMSGIQTPEPPHEPDSGLYQKFPDSSNISKIKKCLDISTWLKLSRQFQNCTDLSGWLQIFQMVSKISKYFQVFSKLSRQFQNCWDLSREIQNYSDLSSWSQNFCYLISGHPEFMTIDNT